MNKKRKNLLIIVLLLFVLIEILNNETSIFLIIFGMILLLLGNKKNTKKKNIVYLLGLFLLLLGVLSTRIIFIILSLTIILYISNHPNSLKIIKENMTINPSKKDNEFLMVNFEEKDENLNLTNNIWIGNENDTETEIYKWQDINYTKALGNTVIDLGNTILPKGVNFIVFRKGFGNTKIIIPETVSLSLNVSMVLGTVIIDGQKASIKNQTFQWNTKNYNTSLRKLKIVSNQIIGELEIIFI